MNLRTKLLVLGLFLLLCILQFLFFDNYYLKSDILGSIITFLSIIFGFYITSLAIFATSSYVSCLYKITDRNNKSVSLLDTLINGYKVGLIFILISLLYFLIIQFIIGQNNDDKIILSDRRTFPFLAIIMFNFIYSYYMLTDLAKIIVQEAKNK